MRGRHSLVAQLVAAVLAAGVESVTIACAGDSVTYGMHGEKMTEEGLQNWPAWLEHHLEKDYSPDHFTVLNLGRSGATAQRQTDRPYREQLCRKSTGVAWMA